MSHEDKLLDAVLNLGLAVKELREEIKGIKKEIIGIKEEMQGMRKEQQMTNLSIRELRLSNMRLADEQAKTNKALSHLPNISSTVVHHEKRIHKLEDKVFKKSA
jgi:hypothetical protein